MRRYRERGKCSVEFWGISWRIPGNVVILTFWGILLMIPGMFKKIPGNIFLNIYSRGCLKRFRRMSLKILGNLNLDLSRENLLIFIKFYKTMETLLFITNFLAVITVFSSKIFLFVFFMLSKRCIYCEEGAGVSKNSE